MGSASSKAARSQVRRYPKAHNPLGTGTLPEARARRGEAISARQDGRPALDADADTGAQTDSFSNRLQQMGVVQPNPTFSPSSTVSHPPPNGGPLDTSKLVVPSSASFHGSPILTTFEARDRLRSQAEAELHDLGSAHAKGRRFADMRHLLDAIRMRDSGASLREVERNLGLRAGILERLGKPGVVSHASG